MKMSGCRIVKFTAALLLVCLAAVNLAALDCNIVLTRAVNTADQFRYIMPNRPPVTPVTTVISRGERIQLPVFIAQCAEKDGKSKVLMTLSETTPDSGRKVLLENKVVWDGKKPDGVALSPFYAEMEMDESDLTGKHVMTADFTDCTDGSTKSVEMPFTLKDAVFDSAEMPQEELEKFLVNYYRSPAPDRLPAAFDAFVKFAEKRSKDKKFTPVSMLYGFARVMEINPYLMPEMIRRANGGSKFHQILFAMLFSGLPEKMQKEYAGKLNAAVAGFCKHYGKVRPLEIKEIKSGADLDALWMEFMLTGRREPVRRIAECLKKVPMLPPDEAKKKMKQGGLSDEEKQHLMNFIICTAARWSLGSNARQHQLVFFYLEEMFCRDTLPDRFSKKQIQEILSKAAAEKKNNKNSELCPERGRKRRRKR